MTVHVRKTSRSHHVVATPRVIGDFARICADRCGDLLDGAASRKPRPHLANIAVPLGMTASVVGQQWWTLIPLGLFAWWWAPRDWGWEWAVAIGRGIISAEWAVTGAYALQAFPDARSAVETSWLLSVVLLAAYAKVLR